MTTVPNESKLKKVEVVKTIVISVLEGDGSESKPLNIVKYYYDSDGNLIFFK